MQSYRFLTNKRYVVLPDLGGAIFFVSENVLYLIYKMDWIKIVMLI
ncbi:hypothetical protein X559_1965 [Paenilisteria newyorkensis]|nr:hypothetical protein X559_1965 [Listeria newyorkensis]